MCAACAPPFFSLHWYTTMSLCSTHVYLAAGVTAAQLVGGARQGGAGLSWPRKMLRARASLGRVPKKLSPADDLGSFSDVCCGSINV